MEFWPPPGDQTQFEANADRARERADKILAASVAQEAADARDSAARAEGPGPLRAVIDRVRSALRSIRGE